MINNGLSINVICRFKLFPQIVCDDNKTLWKLEEKTSKRNKPFRKLTYNESKKAYRINGLWITKSRLLNLRYDCIETIVLTPRFSPF